jgi:hypothetical protein
MCLGMKSRQGQLGTDVSKNANGEWEEKVHRGSGDKSPTRRVQSGCPGYCTNVLNTAGNRKATCDEYPPAATCEGGKGASRHCITDWQNTGIQNKCLSRYTSKLTAGDQFIIRIGGFDCDNADPSSLSQGSDDSTPDKITEGVSTAKPNERKRWEEVCPSGKHLQSLT